MKKTRQKSSFLKKRSKRLLFLGPRMDPGLGRIGGRSAGHKSLLLPQGGLRLFFRKEDSFF
jgi:hypothetical protein